MAQRLNEIGFKVYATVLNTESPGAQELQTNAVFADKMIVLQMDITKDTEVNEVLVKVKRDLQNTDSIPPNGNSPALLLWALVNNAGLFPVGGIDMGSLDSYRDVFEVNVFGTVRVTRSFLPLIKASKGMPFII